MNVESLPTQYWPLLKKYWLPLALFSVGMIFFIYGLISFLGSASKPQVVTFKSDSTAVSSPKIQDLIQIDIEGAVVSPGVYKLSQDSIIKDALVSSGGLSSDADRDYISKNINLAGKLYDGAKIYIPKVGENPIAAQTSVSTDQQNLINVNTASADALDALPGVGPATAEKIINGRPYAKPNDLLDKKVVSAKVFSQIKDKISIY